MWRPLLILWVVAICALRIFGCVHPIYQAFAHMTFAVLATLFLTLRQDSPLNRELTGGCGAFSFVLLATELSMLVVAHVSLH